MQSFKDSTGKSILWLSQNILIVPETGEVAAIILGQSVFGSRGTIKGKYIGQSIYDQDGFIVATEADSIANATLFKDIMQSALKVLQSIKNHESFWVIPKATWNSTPALELLTV